MKAGCLGPAFFRQVRREATAHLSFQKMAERAQVMVRRLHVVGLQVRAIHANLSCRPFEIRKNVIQPIGGCVLVVLEFSHIRRGMLKSLPNSPVLQNQGALL